MPAIAPQKPIQPASVSATMCSKVQVLKSGHGHRSLAGLVSMPGIWWLGVCLVHVVGGLSRCLPPLSPCLAVLPVVAFLDLGPVSLARVRLLWRSRACVLFDPSGLTLVLAHLLCGATPPTPSSTREHCGPAGVDTYHLPRPCESESWGFVK